MTFHVMPAPAASRQVPGILFAEDFDLDARFEVARPAEPAPEPPPPCFSAEELAEACAAARIEARRQALAEAEELHRAACRAALQRIAEQFAVADRAAADVMEDAVGAAAKLIFTCLVTLLPETCSRHEASEIVALVRRLMTGLAPVPVVDVTVAPALEADLRATLQGLPPETRPAVRLIGQKGVPEGDARLSWKTGAASRSRQHVIQGIEDVLRALGLMANPQPEPAALIAAPSLKIMETEHA